MTIAVAAQLTGVPARTLRRWVREDTVPSRHGRRGRLVRVSDVQMAAGTAVPGRPLAPHGQMADIGYIMAAPPGDAAVTDHPAASPPPAPETLLALNEAPVRAVIDQSISSALAPLGAAMERLSERVAHLAADNGRLLADNSRLVAEVERLRALAVAQLPPDAPRQGAQATAGPPPLARKAHPSPTWGARIRRWWRS